MKNKLDLIALGVFVLSVPVCAVAWFADITLLLYITVIPFFCLQLLLCRVTRSLAARFVPLLPVLLALGSALYYAVFGTGWDTLAALIFALASIAPTIGILLGWLVWWLTKRR